ncbi:MAG TPA: hypothetical protein VFZ97_19015, partial [Acidimicrobiales bacterium]
MAEQGEGLDGAVSRAQRASGLARVSTALGMSALALSVSALGLPGIRSAAASVPVFQQAIDVNAPPNTSVRNPLGGGRFSGIACASEGNCTATGFYTDSSNSGQAMSATEINGTWFRATEMSPPAGAAGNPQASLTGTSCSSASNCVAVGGYRDSSNHSQAMVALQTNGGWGTPTMITAPP